ncbi:hypothetical protein MMC25_006208 [Agyrium rufum]|nr:hypothetical protein [Agyrium rufum]
MSFVLPQIPVPVTSFVPYLKTQTLKGSSIGEALTPFLTYESKLREGFAQFPDDAKLKDPLVNAVPVYDGHEQNLKIHARSLDKDNSDAKFIMPLKPEGRRADGSPAVAPSFKKFRDNFNLFSESALTDMDWNNVIAAGSSVLTSLLPIPDRYDESKRALREYYHEQLAPSSDVDLFIYGLDEAAAREKIKQIETRIRDSISVETTTIRTKNAITIVSQYPTRHVQIVLRLYKSISEILTGFDVDCSCFAYDGEQVYGTPRGIVAMMTQINTIDLSRRSPSYESRLSKYSRRGFEVYWPEFERHRIDPTIFERSFARTVGLARLLVLEKLPKPTDREDFIDQRREQRGRPARPYHQRLQNTHEGNIKDDHPDEINEWVYDDGISNYHTMIVPYGPKYHARKIEKLLYTKDILLNAEWNADDDRKINLHRHPCFIGDAEHIFEDCCGACPAPVTDEELEVAEEEAKIFVSGSLEFIKDDPGRQAIGSFHPITTDDWSDMAYVGNTQQLCQAIAEKDLEYVQMWCDSEECVIDRRDHTGRTPLHLAVQSSSPEIVQCLIDHGARITARVIDGYTALHMAAARGEVEMVKSLLEKSESNEEEEAEKEDARKAERKEKGEAATKKVEGSQSDEDEESDDEDEEIDVVNSDDSDEEGSTTTTRSYVRVKGGGDEGTTSALDDASDLGPDVYDVNVTAWDYPVTPLHLAILNGHVETIKILVTSFGAEVLLPYKDSSRGNTTILTLILAAQRDDNTEAAALTKTLLSFGASPAQADPHEVTPVHFAIAMKKNDLLDVFLEHDRAATVAAISHMIIRGGRYNFTVTTSLTAVITSRSKDLTVAEEMALKVLDIGGHTSIDYDDFVGLFLNGIGEYMKNTSREEIEKVFLRCVQQPLLLSVKHEMPSLATAILERGGNPNLTGEKHSLLDIVRLEIEELKKAIEELKPQRSPEISDDPEAVALNEDIARGFEKLASVPANTYEHWKLSNDLDAAKTTVTKLDESRRKKLQKPVERPAGADEKIVAMQALLKRYEDLEATIVSMGGKTWTELHPREETAHNPNVNNPPGAKPAEKTIPKRKTWEARVSFKVPDLTEAKKEGYHRLYEALWSGDDSTVRELCLAKWGPNTEMLPLRIAVQDANGFTPYHIAMYRGHDPLARLVLDIVKIQYQPEEVKKQKFRYSIVDTYDDEAYDDDEEMHTDDRQNDGTTEIKISSELINESFTIANVAELSKTVKSRVSIGEFLRWESLDGWRLSTKPFVDAISEDGQHGAHSFEWNDTKKPDAFRRDFDQVRIHGNGSLVQYAITNRDLGLLKRIFSSLTHALGLDFASQMTVIADHDFRRVLEKGYMEMAEEIIINTAPQLHIGTLVNQTGIVQWEIPKHYKGLKIRGKEKSEWAQRGGPKSEAERQAFGVPTLLTAIATSNRSTIDWALSEAPARLYKEFAHRYLQNLFKAPDSLDKAIDKWLTSEHHLAIHAVVISNGYSDDLLRYLVSVFPEYLDARDSLGRTPLAIAFQSGNIDAAKILVDAGANVQTQDHEDHNVIHLACAAALKDIREGATKLTAQVNLITPEIKQRLLVQRCSAHKAHKGEQTPLGTFISAVSGWVSYSLYGYTPAAKTFKPEHIPILQVLLDASSTGEDLTMLDSSGQSPLHEAIKNGDVILSQTLLAHRPLLLTMENAMGQTPLELAQTMFVRNRVEKDYTNPAMNLKADHWEQGRAFGYQWLSGNQSARDQLWQWEERVFLPGYVEDARDDRVKVWELVRGVAKALVGGGDGSDDDVIGSTDVLVQQWDTTITSLVRKRKLVSVREANEIAKRLAKSAENKVEKEKEEESEDPALERSGNSMAVKKKTQDTIARLCPPAVH